jgi:hypothetical protein
LSTPKFNSLLLDPRPKPLLINQLCSAILQHLLRTLLWFPSNRTFSHQASAGGNSEKTGADEHKPGHSKSGNGGHHEFWHERPGITDKKKAASWHS